MYFSNQPKIYILFCFAFFSQNIFFPQNDKCTYHCSSIEEIYILERPDAKATLIRKTIVSNELIRGVSGEFVKVEINVNDKLVQGYIHKNNLHFTKKCYSTGYPDGTIILKDKSIMKTPNIQNTNSTQSPAKEPNASIEPINPSAEYYPSSWNKARLDNPSSLEDPNTCEECPITFEELVNKLFKK